MNFDEVRRQSSRNLIETYFHLGMAIPGSETVEEAGFKACLGEFEHPICNFAADLDLDPWVVRRLSAMAIAKSVFNVYALPSDKPNHLGELLTRGDFQVHYRMALLTCRPEPQKGCAAMVPASDLQNRKEIARFMTEQFFPRQTEDFRVRVAAATTDVIKFKLMELQSEGERVGALMLYENDQSVGLYNLCVASKMRGLGVGATMTRWAIDYAYHQRKMITLQCDARLQTWYEEQSFDWVGTVDVYSLSNRPKSDIMNGT